MKKVLITVFALISMSTSIVALDPVDYKVFYKLENQSTFNSLVKYLEADDNQIKLLKNVVWVTNENLKSAQIEENGEFAEKVLNYNLKNASAILDYNQYRKYLKIINLSINNAEIDYVLLTEK